MVMPRTVVFALSALALLPAYAADTNYAKIEVVAGVQKQVRYHATGKKDCTAAAPPQVTMIEPPSQGFITVKQAILTTSRVPGCSDMKLPVRVVFYTGNSSAVGRDHFVYQAKDVNGQIQVFDYTVEIKAAPKAPPPAGGKGI